MQEDRETRMDILWSEDKARGLDELELLAYRSNLLGSDPRIVNRGGGNTSVKRKTLDFKSELVDVLTVKGSGADLRTITKAGFVDVVLKDVLPLVHRESMSDEGMVDYLSHCLIDPSAPRPSIETLLHAFLPFTHIDHTHADASVALCTAHNGRQIMKDVFGTEAIWVPFAHPGFMLSKMVAEAVAGSSNVRFVFLGNHGLVAWGDSSEECYRHGTEATTRIDDYIQEKAKGKQKFGGIRVKDVGEEARRKAASALLPSLRGALSSEKSVILHFDSSPDVIELINSESGEDLSSRGLTCPDHVLYTKAKPLFVNAPEDISDNQIVRTAVLEAVGRYQEEYRSFFKRNRTGNEAMLESIPKVILVSNIGMITAGKDKRSAAIAADYYHRAIAIMHGASALGEFTSINEKESFEFEYWPLELYKLTLMPPEKELARKVAFITGAAGAIGKAMAQKFAEDGAHVVLADINLESAYKTSEAINEIMGTPVTTAVQVDVTSEASTAKAIEHAVMTFGGLDIAIANAGIASASSIDSTSLEEWAHHMDVLVNGYFLTAREALKVLKQQKTLDGPCLGGNIIIISSKAALLPGKGAAAYGTAKAATAHFARILAEEAAPFGIRANTIAPDAVIRGSGLWAGQWGRDRAEAHGIAVDELEEFYRQRNLLKTVITAEDVAEAALFFASGRSAKTTGALLTVDGGLSGGFVR